jgi:hypothetical protein
MEEAATGDMDMLLYMYRSLLQRKVKDFHFPFIANSGIVLIETMLYTDNWPK